MRTYTRSVLKLVLHFVADFIGDIKGFHVPDELAFRQKLSFLFGGYEKETADFIRTHVRGGTAFDVGAHVGYYSRLLSPLVDKVFAFEPEPRNFKLLVENMKHFPNVVPINAAVSDQEGGLSFFLVKGSTFRHSLIDEGDCERIVVHAVKLDAFTRKNSIKNTSFVKIDVEGHEDAVLAGMAEIIATQRPLVIAEMPINEKYLPVSKNIGRHRTVRNYVVS